VDVEGGCLTGVGERNDSSEHQRLVGVDLLRLAFRDARSSRRILKAQPVKKQKERLRRRMRPALPVYGARGWQNAG
jgi:hypothetical protein